MQREQVRFAGSFASLWPRSAQRLELAGLVAVLRHHGVDLVGHAVERLGRGDLAGNGPVEAEFEDRR